MKQGKVWKESNPLLSPDTTNKQTNQLGTDEWISIKNSGFYTKKDPPLSFAAESFLFREARARVRVCCLLPCISYTYKVYKNFDHAFFFLPLKIIFSSLTLSFYFISVLKLPKVDFRKVFSYFPSDYVRDFLASPLPPENCSSFLSYKRRIIFGT